MVSHIIAAKKKRAEKTLQDFIDDKSVYASKKEKIRYHVARNEGETYNGLKCRILYYEKKHGKIPLPKIEVDLNNVLEPIGSSNKWRCPYCGQYNSPNEAKQRKNVTRHIKIKHVEGRSRSS